MWHLCLQIWKKEGFAGLFAGLGPKAVHTLIANFAYFYWYSFLKQTYERKIGPMSTTSNLAIASLAGALNMTMTIPLEVITTRAQTQEHPGGLLGIVKEIYEEKGIAAFWKGYIPSLVLTSNPAINYTLFDRLKLKVQNAHVQLTNAKRPPALTVTEAFIIAAIAKSVATVITYPVIRAKVIMQAQKRKSKEKNNSSTDSEPYFGDSMVEVLQNIQVIDGMSGYFKGCNAQMFNTVLKSAILLMSKEQITRLTIKVLVAMRKKNQALK